MSLSLARRWVTVRICRTALVPSACRRGRVLRPLLGAAAAKYHLLLLRQLSIPTPEGWQSGTAAAASVTRHAAFASAPSRVAASSL